MVSKSITFAHVILPLRITMDVTYIVPEPLIKTLRTGSFVRVPFSGSIYIAVVDSLTNEPPPFKGEIKEIESVEPIFGASKNEIEFWKWIAEYYMCTVGEVFKAAFPEPLTKTTLLKRKRVIRSATVVEAPSELSPAQQEALIQIEKNIKTKMPTLLKGVTGSGKTEIYIQLAHKAHSRGENVLIMVPEIALSRQLSERLENIFGDDLLVYHSKQSSAVRRDIYSRVKEGSNPYIILGLRSSVFLPFEKLGIIIVDEEHDASYKQSEPAPRYNGRDSALILSKIHSAGVVLGSATPSLESIYNSHSGRYSLVELNEKFYGDHIPSVTIIDTIREQKRGKMEGLFSQTVLDEIKDRLSKGEQTLIFRNRRSYSPLVQCIYCGDIPHCLHCNVSLSYHKNRGALSCHYCDYSKRFTTICTKCGRPGLKERGCGTEMIEEQIRGYFPQARVARFDAETTARKSQEAKILREFVNGETDILIGTQMVSKGFDFEKLTLIVLVQADSMFAVEDFRSSERAMQMLVQLAGRGGRRYNKGQIIVQTAQPQNIIYQQFEQSNSNIAAELEQRGEFEYPPFTRLIKIVIKGGKLNSVDNFAQSISRL
ncbi:MAG: primosomal protein N', partial [Bacteroidales bacterium]|nr:primosomal protein N' [Bacteroidales bacterium]